MIDPKGKHIAILGGARSGVAAARMLVDRGATVLISEYGTGSDALREAAESDGIRIETGDHSADVLNADFVVISPGVPDASPIVGRILEAGIPLYSELEVASWFCPGPMIAVTGSNGKTTTTTLIAHVIRSAGRPLVVAGNIGYPLSAHVADCTPETAVVLEVSSFQLDHVSTFHPRVAVLLNITPDHLDRYGGDFNAYAQSKFRIFERLEPGDFLVYNDDDPESRPALAVAKRRGLIPYAISIEHEVGYGAFVRDGHIILRMPSSPFESPTDSILMATQDLSLRGRHNLYNSLAAAIAARATEISSDVIRESLTTFEGVPHRLEFVRELHGIRYVNDSKATNVNALWYALESFSEPVILIAGGRDKGNDYTPVQLLVKDRCRGVVGIGESGDKVVRDLGDHAKAAARAESLEEALQYARLMAEPGDVILLSPACASFDQYSGFEARGDHFKLIVNAL